jgi:hypothetical protein
MNEIPSFNEGEKVRFTSRNATYLTASVSGQQTPRPNPPWMIEARRRFLEQRKQSLPRPENGGPGEKKHEV